MMMSNQINRHFQRFSSQTIVRERKFKVSSFRQYLLRVHILKRVCEIKMNFLKESMDRYRIVVRRMSWSLKRLTRSFHIKRIAGAIILQKMEE